jgi:hypothetical protein
MGCRGNVFAGRGHKALTEGDACYVAVAQVWKSFILQFTDLFKLPAAGRPASKSGEIVPPEVTGSRRKGLSRGRCFLTHRFAGE